MSRFVALATAVFLLTACLDHPPDATKEAAATSPDATTETGSTVAEPGGATDPMILFDFEGDSVESSTAEWRVENDGVMGGRSQGAAEIAEGRLVFTGEVVTAGGGFTSVRAPKQADLSGYDGIALRVRGGGRTFELDVDDGTRSRGREVTRRGSIPTTSAWETVQVSFDALKQSAHGEPVSAGPLNRAAIKSIGIYIIDGKDGAFRIEIDKIWAYRSEAPAG